MPAHHPIAVVGAGLGGLTLAAVLHRNGIEAAVYDLDASPTARQQGGMLDIHEDTGQVALRAAGLFDAFQAIIHPGGQAMRVLDKHGAVHLEEADDENRGRPEVHRTALRRVLLSGVPGDAIRWGAKVTRARTLEDGRHEVTLADGATFTADLLIGADGAWSKVRALVSDVVPIYAGVSFAELNLLDADVRHPRSTAVVGGGMLFALSDEKGFLAHRESDGRLHVYVALKTPADWYDSGPIDFSDPRKAKAGLLESFADWDESLRALVLEADGALVPRPIHALPTGHRWERTPGVTLLGDAAHLMSPFAGEGANLALFDAAELAAAIVAHPDDVETALAEYEQALFPRSEAAAVGSAAGLEMCFSPNAPMELLEMFAQHQPPPE